MMRTILSRVPEELYNKLEEISVVEDRTKSSVVRRILTEALKDEP